MGSFGRGIMAVGKTVGGSVAKIGRLPGVGMIPVVGNVLSAVGAASAVYGAAKGIQGMMKPTGGLPALPGMGGSMIQPGQTGGFGIPRGPGGSMQLPWKDPAIPEYLKQFALDDSFLRTGVRAPRGYVVIRDGSGRPFAVLKTVAKAFKLWKAKAKPPISVRDWHHLQGAGRVVNKLQDMEKVAKKIANWKAPKRTVIVGKKK